MRKLYLPLTALCLLSAFDGGSCGNDDPDPEPSPKDHEFRADQLSVLVKLDLVHLVAVDVSLVRPYTFEGSQYSEEVSISSSRFFWNGTEMVAPFRLTLDASIEASTLTYVDVDGAEHEIAIPALPDTFVSEALPATIPRTEPLEIFWDGLPEAPADDDVRVNIRNVEHLTTRERPADVGAQSVIFPLAVVQELGTGPIEVEIVRERTLRDVAGTNGGRIITRQHSPTLGSTLE